jgi:hypothetical protein
MLMPKPIAVFAVVVLGLSLPGTVAGQASSSLAYRPSPAAAGINTQAAVAATAATDTVMVDPYAIDNSVAYGAAIGGIIGGVVVAVHTLADASNEPISWGAAVGLPILGGLIGAGVGYVLR